jgi:hypothetical protein
MPNFSRPQLSVRTDHSRNEATVTVSCNLEFTEFEYNGMNWFGLWYTLECQLLDGNMLDLDKVISFTRKVFPRIPGGIQHFEYVEFKSTAPLSLLQRYISGEDTLAAKLTLRDEQNVLEQTKHSADLRVNLAA